MSGSEPPKRKFFGIFLIMLAVLLIGILGFSSDYLGREKTSRKDMQKGVPHEVPSQEPTRAHIALQLDPNVVANTFSDSALTEKLLLTPIQPTPNNITSAPDQGVMGALKHLDVAKRHKGAMIVYKSNENTDYKSGQDK